MGEHHALPCCRLKLIPGEWGLQGSRQGKQPTFLRAPGRGESKWMLPGAPSHRKQKEEQLFWFYLQIQCGSYSNLHLPQLK